VIAVSTVLYEDSRIGKEYPLHRLVMRLVEDEINGQSHLLQKLVLDNPRNGVDKVLGDIRMTSLVAGAGSLFVLVDRDRIVAHINQNSRGDEPRVRTDASDDDIEAALRLRSDAPNKLHAFLLRPNMEGLIASIRTCAPGFWPDVFAAAIAKDRFARDRVLMETAKLAMASIRACVRDRQPGLDRLAKAIASTVPKEALGLGATGSP
jgi:hypothetical protein